MLKWKLKNIVGDELPAPVFVLCYSTIFILRNMGDVMEGARGTKVIKEKDKGV
jgi:hypothetical protein